MQKDILSNIIKLYFIKIAKWFMLIMPIIVLFYQENGLNMFDVMLLQGIYSVAVVLLEIPSGYFADVWGRKNTIIIGSVLGVLGYVAYSLSYGFWGFLIAELILGIGQSLISGSDSALLYDTLLDKKREDDYMKMEGRVLSIGNFAETIGVLTGGFLAEISLRTPFICQIGVALIAVPAAITLIEPKRQKLTSKSPLETIIRILKNSLIHNRRLKWNIIYSAVIGTATLSMAWMVQPYLKNILNMHEYQIGIALAMLNLTVGLTTLRAYKLEQKLGRAKTLLFITFFISAGYLAISFIGSWWALVPLIVFYFTRGIATPVLKEYINKLCKSEERATILSIRNFVIRFIFFIVGPFLGWYSDKFSLTSALLIASISFVTLSMFALAFFIKNGTYKE